MNNKLIGIFAIACVLLLGCGGGSTDSTSTDTTADSTPTSTTNDTTPTMDTGLLEAYAVFDYNKTQEGHLFGECIFDNGDTEPTMYDSIGWWYVGYPDRDPDYLTTVRGIVDGSISYQYDGIATANVHKLYLESYFLTFADNGDSLSGIVGWRYYDTQEIIYCHAIMVKGAKTSVDLDFYR